MGIKDKITKKIKSLGITATLALSKGNKEIMYSTGEKVI